MDLVVLDQGIDTSTAVGRMFFQILGAIADGARSDVGHPILRWPATLLRIAWRIKESFDLRPLQVGQFRRVSLPTSSLHTKLTAVRPRQPHGVAPDLP